MNTCKSTSVIFIASFLVFQLLNEAEADKECIYPETIKTRLQNGTWACLCDRSRGYFGYAEDACFLKKCGQNMEPDIIGLCRCIDKYFLKDGVCIQKRRCNESEIVVHNGGPHEDRRCRQNTSVLAPYAEVTKITTSSFQLEVKPSDENAQILHVTYHQKGTENQKSKKKEIGCKKTLKSKLVRYHLLSEGDKNLTEIEVKGLEMETAYEVEVKTQSFAGFSDSRHLSVKTKPAGVTQLRESSTAVIVGTTIGCGSFVVILVIGVVLYRRWKKRRQRDIRIPQNEDRSEFLPPRPSPLQHVDILEMATSDTDRKINDETEGENTVKVIDERQEGGAAAVSDLEIPLGNCTTLDFDSVLSDKDDR